MMPISFCAVNAAPLSPADAKPAMLEKEIDTKVREILRPYYDEEVSVLYEGITAEEFDRLTEANDLTLAAFEFLNEKLILA